MMEFYRFQQRAVQLYDVNHSRKAGDAYREHQMDLHNWRRSTSTVHRASLTSAAVYLVNRWLDVVT